MIHWSELGWTAPEIEMEATHKLTPDYDNENSRCEKEVKFIPRQNTPWRVLQEKKFSLPEVSPNKGPFAASK